MALSYTDFMAAGGALSTSEVVRDVSDVLNAILLKDTATLGKIKGRGVTTNKKHEWVEDSLNPVTFTASYDHTTNTLTISDPSTSANVQKIVRTGALCFFLGTSFVLQFGTTPVTGANTMTVYSGTDATVASSTCYVVCLPYTDETGLSEDIARARTLRWNSTQIFERTMQVTKTRRGLELYAVGSGDKDFQMNIKNRTLEAKRELNISVVSPAAVPYYSGGYSANTARSTMAGIPKLIHDPDLDATDEDTTVIAAGGADISNTLLNNMVYKVYDNGGLDDSASPVFIMHHYQKQKFVEIGEEIRRTTRNDDTVGYSAEVFMSKLGIEIPICVDRWCAKDTVILLDTSRCRLITFKGDTWNLVKVPLQNSRMDAYQLSGQFTVELSNAEEAHGMITGLSTT